MVIDKLIPAMKEKWPSQNLSKEVIFIQQDNAKPHIEADDESWITACQQQNVQLTIDCQPPNSPDLNVLDLGFFRAIQSIQYQKSASSIDELIFAVETAFEELSSESLNDVFLTLQSVLIEILKYDGGNHFKIPHLGKSSLRRNDALPDCLDCPDDLIFQYQFRALKL